MLFNMCLFVQEAKLAHASFPHNGMMLFKMCLSFYNMEIYPVLALFHVKMMLFEMRLFVQEAKLARTSFPPQWNDVVRDVLVCVQERKIACTSFHL